MKEPKTVTRNAPKALTPTPLIEVRSRVDLRDFQIRIGGVHMLRRTMHCSFCGRSDSEVAKLVAGPRRLFAGPVYICDCCAAQTIQIMEAYAGDDRPRRQTQSFFRRTLNRLGWSRRRDVSSRSECRAT